MELVLKRPDSADYDSSPQPARILCVVKFPLKAYSYYIFQMWIILEPVIFALIGTEIQIDKIDPSTIGYGTIVLVGALLIRFLCVPRKLSEQSNDILIIYIVPLYLLNIDDIVLEIYPYSILLKTHKA